MGKVGFLLVRKVLIVGFLVGSFIKFDMAGAVRKTGWLLVLDFKWCLEGLFLFQFPVDCIYHLYHDTSYHGIIPIGVVFSQAWYIY